MNFDLRKKMATGIKKIMQIQNTSLGVKTDFNVFVLITWWVIKKRLFPAQCIAVVNHKFLVIVTGMIKISPNKII